MVSPYQVLGISPSASLEEVKSAWKKQVKITHPDLGGDPQAFLKINQAYHTIINNTYEKTNYSPPPTPNTTKTNSLKKIPKSFILLTITTASLIPILSSLISSISALIINTPTPTYSINSILDILNMTAPFALIAYLLKQKLHALYQTYPKSLIISTVALTILNPLNPALLVKYPILIFLNIAQLAIFIFTIRYLIAKVSKHSKLYEIISRIALSTK